MAFYKAQDAARPALPLQGTLLFSIAERDRDKRLVRAARSFEKMGFKLLATSGTQRFLQENGVSAEHILKVYEGRPNIDDAIKNRDIQLVVNTPSGKLSATDDSYVRKSAIRYKVPYITTLAAALAAAEGIGARIQGDVEVKALQDYHT